MNLLLRFYRFSQRLQVAVTDQLILIVLSVVLFLLLTFVLDFKDFLRDAFAVVD